MQRLLHVLAAILVATCCTGLASGADSAAEGAARRWLASRKQAPGADELAELKGANPEAYAIVQALLMKKNMGLIKRNPQSTYLHSATHGGFELPPVLSTPLEPNMLAPVPPTITEQGAPPAQLTLNGPAEPLRELYPPTPTAPPAMPPPPPISSELPPPLPDIDNIGQSSQSASPADATVESGSLAPAPASEQDAAMPLSLSAAATSSSVYTGSTGGNFGLNWNPDKMIDDNEKMVQNVLGAVAQLTGAHVHRGVIAHKDDVESPRTMWKPSDDVDAPVPPSPQHQEVVEPVVEIKPRPIASPPRAKAATRVSAEKPTDTQHMVASVDAVETATPQSAADLYLSSSDSATEPGPSAPMKRTTEASEASDDDVAAHLPETLSWNNPYTFTASANAKGPAVMRQNSYLKDIDLGVPQYRLPPKRPDDENPYLQGLDLVGKSAAPAPTSISASALTAMHQNQLLSSHTLLDSFEWGGNSHASLQQHKTKVSEAAKKTKDVLGGFLRSGKSKPKKIPVAPKNTYLAKLGDAAAPPPTPPSSVLASDIEQDNPYLQTLDDAPVPQAQPLQEAQPNLRNAKQQVPRDRLASFNWDDKQQQVARKSQESRQLSMASSKVHQNVGTKAVAKKKQHALSGWLGGAAVAKGPSAASQRLQQTIALKVADAKNPYLKGLDIDSDVPKLQVQQKEENPYMASFD